MSGPVSNPESLGWSENWRSWIFYILRCTSTIQHIVIKCKRKVLIPLCCQRVSYMHAWDLIQPTESSLVHRRSPKSINQSPDSKFLGTESGEILISCHLMNSHSHDTLHNNIFIEIDLWLKDQIIIGSQTQLIELNTTINKWFILESVKVTSNHLHAGNAFIQLRVNKLR